MRKSRSVVVEKEKTQVATSNYNKTVLSNGIRVVSESIPHVKSVSLGVWVDVGSRDESDLIILMMLSIHLKLKLDTRGILMLESFQESLRLMLLMVRL